MGLVIWRDCLVTSGTNNCRKGLKSGTVERRIDWEYRDGVSKGGEPYGG